MGKVTFLPIQRQIFEEFSKTDFSKHFYFTGGTALSAFYLHHRISEDLDFFTEKDFDNEVLYSTLELISKKLGLKFSFTQQYRNRIIEFSKAGKFQVKVDFNYYPFKRIQKGIIYQSFEIDSVLDIAINKLLTINQRTDVKDFVDLYFLLKEFTFWDLLIGVERKFRMKLDMILIASDFMKVEQFDILPKMLVKLKLSDLQDFFREKSRGIGERIVKYS